MGRLRAAWLGGGALLAAGSAAPANITVRGTVYYGSGGYLNADGTRGAYALARKTQIQVENDRTLVGDIDTWTDASGRYEVPFKQQVCQPDFDSLSVDIEVRAGVRLATLKRTGPDDGTGHVWAWGSNTHGQLGDGTGGPHAKGGRRCADILQRCPFFLRGRS